MNLAVSSSNAQIRGSSDVTRATEIGDLGGEFNENDINRVDIFFYQDETLIWYPEDVYYEPVTGKAAINVPSDKESLFEDAKYDIYVVVNGPSRTKMENKSLPELRDLVVTTDFGTTNRIAALAEFLMDGFMLDKEVSLASPDLGTIELKRAAAKLRIRILKGPVIDSYIDGNSGATPLVATRNYNPKATLMQNSTIIPSNSLENDADFSPATSLMTEGSFPGSKTPYPIYTYPNDWSIDRERETHAIIRMPLKTVDSDLDGIKDGYRYYYYKVPINPQKPEGPQSEAEKAFYRVDRNLIYDVEVYINQLGSTDDDTPVTLAGNYTILNWNEQPVGIKIDQGHYLFVKPQYGDMMNTTTYVLDYSSSQLPITVSNIQASYTYTNINGVRQTVNYPTGSVKTGTPEVPSDGSVWIYINQPTTGKITVTSVIPTNEVPKDISFTVSNGITIPNLNQPIRIRQLPQYYITSILGDRSNLSTDDGILPAGYTNKSIYTLTSLSPSGTTITGFPPVNEVTKYTVNSQEVAEMVAPSFMVASELGAYGPTTYEDAAAMCAKYWEERPLINGVRTFRYEGWRLPTEAELQFIYDRQTSASGIVKSILRNTYYWDAYSGNDAYYMIGGTDTGTYNATSKNAYVRCVRDVKN